MITISICAITQISTRGVYLQNNYGVQIQCVGLSPSMIIKFPGAEPIHTMGNGHRVKINTGVLSIRTPGGTWYDLTPQVQSIVNPTEWEKHNPDNAIITVLPSFFTWNIRIDWEKESEKRSIKK